MSYSDEWANEQTRKERMLSGEDQFLVPTKTGVDIELELNQSQREFQQGHECIGLRSRRELRGRPLPIHYSSTALGVYEIDMHIGPQPQTTTKQESGSVGISHYVRLAESVLTITLGHPMHVFG